MVYKCAHTRTNKVKMTDNTKCWYGCCIRIHILYTWDGKQAQSFWKENHRQQLLNTNIFMYHVPALLYANSTKMHVAVQLKAGTKMMSITNCNDWNWKQSSSYSVECRYCGIQYHYSNHFLCWQSIKMYTKRYVLTTSEYLFNHNTNMNQPRCS